MVYFSLSLSPPSPFQVPLSVPSQPTTPKTQAEQPPTDSSVNIENGVEALSLEDTPQVSALPDSLMPAPSMVVRSTPQKQAISHDVTPPLSEGVQQSQLSNQQAAFPIQGTNTITTSSPQVRPEPTQMSPPPSSGSGFQPGVANSQQLQAELGGVYNMAPPTATQSSTLPGASTVPYSMPVGGSHGYGQTTPTVQATPSYGAPQMTGTYPSSSSSQAPTLSGLPTVPPTISLPSVAPTISLGPTPNLIPAMNTAQ